MSNADEPKANTIEVVTEMTGKEQALPQTLTASDIITMEQVNPELNYGPYLTAPQLERAGLKANRVPIPGDSDYQGVCVFQDGVWKAS